MGDTARRAGDFEMWRGLNRLEGRDRHKLAVNRRYIAAPRSGHRAAQCQAKL